MICLRVVLAGLAMGTVARVCDEPIGRSPSDSGTARCAAVIKINNQLIN